MLKIGRYVISFQTCRNNSSCNTQNKRKDDSLLLIQGFVIWFWLIICPPKFSWSLKLLLVWKFLLEIKVTWSFLIITCSRRYRWRYRNALLKTWKVFVVHFYFKFITHFLVMMFLTMILEYKPRCLFKSLSL